MKLPKFIFDKVKNHKTSLGENEAFPPGEGTPFDYKIVKRRFLDVMDVANHFDVSNTKTRLSQLITECQKIEEPIKNQLETLSASFVNHLFEIPSETMDISCKLVTKLEPKTQLRVTPEDSSKKNFDFEDLNEIGSVGKAILKRRLLNSLVQGAAYCVLEDFLLTDRPNPLVEELEKLNKNLPKLYMEVIGLNDYILFTEEEKISDKRYMQGSCVDVTIGRADEQVLVEAQGILFPFLLNECVRGIFEFIASQELPQDIKKAKYLMGQTDFLLAEPWDLRMGVELWKLILPSDYDYSVLPYYFMHLIDRDNIDDFNKTMQEIFANTKRGQSIKDEIYEESLLDYQDIQSSVDEPIASIDTDAILNDSYLSVDDLDDEIIEEEDDDIDDENLNDDYVECDNIEEAFSLLYNLNESDIDFIETPIEIIKGFSMNNITNMLLVANGVIIPQEVVQFKIEIKSFYGRQYYQPHVWLHPEVRGNGLCSKMYYAFARLYGPLSSFFMERKSRVNKRMGIHNHLDDAIDGVWGSLSRRGDCVIEPIYDLETDRIVGETLVVE